MNNQNNVTGYSKEAVSNLMTIIKALQKIDDRAHADAAFEKIAYPDNNTSVDVAQALNTINATDAPTLSELQIALERASALLKRVKAKIDSNDDLNADNLLQNALDSAGKIAEALRKQEKLLKARPPQSAADVFNPFLAKIAESMSTPPPLPMGNRDTSIHTYIDTCEKIHDLSGKTHWADIINDMPQPIKELYKLKQKEDDLIVRAVNPRKLSDKTRLVNEFADAVFAELQRRQSPELSVKSGTAKDHGAIELPTKNQTK